MSIAYETAHRAHTNGNGNGVHKAPPITIDAPDLRMPPHNVEVEQRLLGTLMLEAIWLHQVAQIVVAEDFFRDVHQTIYKAILGLYNDGKPFDAMAVGLELERRGEFKAVGGDETLWKILGATTSTANAVYYAGIIREKAIARNLGESARLTLEETYSNQHTADELLDQAERRLFAIAERQVGSSSKDSAALADEAWARLQSRLNGEVEGIGCGIPAIDMITNGFRPGNMIILAARPSMGKTAAALNFCESIALIQGVATLFVSLEMVAGELSDRLLSGQSRISASRLVQPQFLKDWEWAAIEKARKRIAAGRLIVEDAPSLTLTQIGAMARYHQARNSIGFMAIDYLSLIDGQARGGESRQEEVARVSRGLKKLARELKIPVLVLHQLNRQNENRSDPRPKLSDLRESGQIEQDADLVMLLHRRDYYDATDCPGTAEFIVAKQRTGRTGTAEVAFVKELTRFEPLARNVDVPIDTNVAITDFGPAPTF